MEIPKLTRIGYIISTLSTLSSVSTVNWKTLLTLYTLSNRSAPINTNPHATTQSVWECCVRPSGPLIFIRICLLVFLIYSLLSINKTANVFTFKWTELWHPHIKIFSVFKYLPFSIIHFLQPNLHLLLSCYHAKQTLKQKRLFLVYGIITT